MLDPNLEYKKASDYDREAQWFNFRLFLARICKLQMGLFEASLVIGLCLMGAYLISLR